THRGALDAHIVWNEFSTWVLCYSEALRRRPDYFDASRRSDPVALDEFEWLYHKIVGIESRKRRLPPDRVCPGDFTVDEFLLAERELDSAGDVERVMRGLETGN